MDPSGAAGRPRERYGEDPREQPPDRPDPERPRPGRPEKGQRDDAWRRRWLRWARAQEKRAAYSPWLLIRTQLTDTGARPLPGGTAYWCSPDIWTTSPDPLGRPIAGSPCGVHCRVTNLGSATAAPTQVDFFWANPGVGLDFGSLHRIGRAWVEVPAGHSVVVTCPTPWVPLLVNGGHECLFAHCHNHILDPLLHPAQPWLDRHVGQRNITVLAAPAEGFVTLSLWMANPMMEQGTARLRVLGARARSGGGLDPHLLAGEPLARLSAAVSANLLAQAPAIKMASAPLLAMQRVDETKVDVEVGEQVPLAEPNPGRAVGLSADTVPRANLAGLTTALELAAHGLTRRHLQATWHFGPPPGRDELLVLHVFGTVGDAVVGGYTVVLHGMEEDMAERATGSERKLLDAVLQTFPEVRVVWTLANALARHLPIENAERLEPLLAQAGRTKIEGETLPLATLARLAPEEIFPIRTELDLVKALAGGVRIVVAHAAQLPGTQRGARAVINALAQGMPVTGQRTGVGHFSAASLFGATPAQKK